MRNTWFAALAAAAVVIPACSFLGAAHSMRQTRVVSSDTNYDKLVTAATDLGWKSHKRVGEWKSMEDWNLTVNPVEGETIIFTLNNFSKNIDFTCRGGKLEDKEVCVTHANKLLAPAFNGVY